MMTNEEVINVLNNLIRQFTRIEQMTTATALKFAVGAVLKQKPREMSVRTVADINTYYCPYCREKIKQIGWTFLRKQVLIPNDPKYCYNCGQRLKWE